MQMNHTLKALLVLLVVAALIVAIYYIVKRQMNKKPDSLSPSSAPEYLFSGRK